MVLKKQPKRRRLRRQEMRHCPEEVASKNGIEPESPSPSRPSTRPRSLPSTPRISRNPVPADPIRRGHLPPSSHKHPPATMPTGTKRRSGSQLLTTSQKQRRVQPLLTRGNGGGSAGTRPNGPPPTSNGSQGTAGQGDDHRRELPNVDLDNLTGLLPGDVNAISMIVNAAEKRIMSHVSNMCHKVTLDVKANELMMTDLSKNVRTLDTNVSNLKVLTLQNSVTIARSKTTSRTGSKSNKSVKSALQNEIEAKHPNIIAEFPAVFHSEVFSRAAGHSVCSYMESFHRAQDDYRMTARTLSVMLYGLQTHMHRVEFKQGVGKQHANFRFKIALCATREALLLTNDVFKEQEKQVIADLVREGKILPGQIEPTSRKPSWLTPRMLTKGLMVNARKYHECVKSEHSPVPAAQNQRLALHVCRCVVKCIIDMLRLSRERCKVKLCDAGLFLLVDWSKRDAFRPGHSQPVLRFVNPTAAPISPDSVQDCSTSNVENYEHINSVIFKSLMESRLEMIIEATYMVTVTIRKAPRGSEENDVTELREMCRQFNILRMALVFVKAYKQTSEEVVLSSDPSILRNVYRIAILLREFFIDRVEESFQPIRATARTNEESDDMIGPQSTRSNSPSGALHGPVNDTPGEGRGRNDTDDQSQSANGTQRTSRTRNGSQRRNDTERIPSITLKQLLAGDYEMENTISKVLKISSDLYDKLRVTDDEEEVEERNVREEERTEAIENGDEFDFSRLDSDDEELMGMVDM